MAKSLMENIEAFMAPEKKVVEIVNGKKTVKFEINEDVNIDDIHETIELIVEQVVDQDWSYDLIDILISYWIIKLFTNIPAPMIDDDIPDYKKCLDIYYKLDLDYYLYENSIIVSKYIELIQKNIWRKLELKKAELTLLPWEKLIDGLGEFYEILDTLEKYTELQGDIDIEGLASQLNELVKEVGKVKELAEAN